MSRGTKVEVPATVVLSYDEKRRKIRVEVRVEGLPKKTFFVRKSPRGYCWAHLAERLLLRGGAYVG